jgi:ribulose-phosphate 3-epimerase
MSVRIAPSILSADFARLGEAVAMAERGGADLIHVDVMDGHFVPNITIGVPVVKSLKRIAKVPLDVHLMIENPDQYIGAFAEAGASMVSVHVEAVRHIHRTVQAIKALGVQAGVAINPGTPVIALREIAGDLDYVVVMSVNPGFGGQTFIPHSESKIREVRAILDEAGNAAPHNVARVVAAGARIVVAGSAVFNTPDPERATRELKGAALGAVTAAAR